MVAARQSVEIKTALPPEAPPGCPRLPHVGPRRARLPEVRGLYDLSTNPRRAGCLAHCLRRVARIAPGPKVVEVEPKVRPHLYRDLMVRVQVTLALAETLSQLGQHLFNGRRAKFELPEVLHQVRLPAAVDATPLIANEAKNPKAPMLGVVTAGCRSTTLFILLLRHTFLVGRAIPGFAKCSASGLATRAKRKITHWCLGKHDIDRLCFWF